jgi:TrpR-related protein YerC/YecD
MNWKTNKNQRLIQAILTLKTENEAKRFLRDLMTEKEIKEFSNRFMAAEMLIEQASYSEIIKQTGLSSTTVARVSRWLNGQAGGYRTVIAKLHHHPIQSRSGLS